MRVRKLGQWRHEGPYGNYDHGFYLEAIDVPSDQPRHAAVSYMFIDDDDIRRLARQEIVSLPLHHTDLAVRIDTL